MDQFPLKARLDTTGRASTYDDMHTQVTRTADRFFGPGRWKVLDFNVDTHTATSMDGNDVYFPFTATVAGPTHDR
jgi:hypothetical protein